VGAQTEAQSEAQPEAMEVQRRRVRLPRCLDAGCGDHGAGAQSTATAVRSGRVQRPRYGGVSGRWQDLCGRTYNKFDFVSTKHYAGGAEGRRGKTKKCFRFRFVILLWGRTGLL
jgi:hypothetical protein